MILLYFREKRTTSGYFTVDPVLRVNKKETIPLECVSLQTVLSKSLGPLAEWSDRLRVSVLYTCNTATSQKTSKAVILYPEYNINKQKTGKNRPCRYFVYIQAN